MYEIFDESGAVINTIIADAAFVEANYPGRYREVEALAPEPVLVQRHISVGAFYDRFGAAKYQVLADTNPIVQALIKDTSVRQFIDLDRADLPAALQMLVDAGHAIDPDAILSTEIAAHELP